MLSELSGSDWVELGVLDHDELPVAPGRVEHHLVDELAALVCKLSEVDIEFNILLVIVSHELELDA